MQKGSWRSLRVTLLLLFGGVMVAAYLLPLSPVGLPLCLFKVVTGYPCAGCGLTRSVIAAAHGRFGESFRWHPMGLLLVWAMWAAGALMLYELLTGKGFSCPLSTNSLRAYKTSCVLPTAKLGMSTRPPFRRVSSTMAQSCVKHSANGAWSRLP